ncbi:LexA-binding, inner membrane-associated putative hydrolase [Halobiforma haloterrestris]|uniref:LexA-binding, inner membrane-associated putative hydrolase n=1 Tax=Natronobacterium haloterrestre TaxID=148448 RepID=A0A1I1HTL8_NATHA|nr:metal-dependent hydrolase [Halobiforma haloterrestris]SFC24330.1 LexA-binding, inner membrane-associated putative hydrolase [Halobiforma haloterrestris]
MWPWEHALVGYLAYSLCCHAFHRESPGGLEAFAVVVASVLPDLIDKPLAWEFGVFESGYALGHSIFVAVPLAIVVGSLARAWGRSRAGLAFGLGYLLHLPADVVDGYVRGGYLEFGIVLWPVAPVETPPTAAPAGFLSEFSRLFAGYREQLLAGELSTYLWLQFGIVVLTALLWLYDGAPVARECLAGGKRTLVSLGSSIRGLRERRER